SNCVAQCRGAAGTWIAACFSLPKSAAFRSSERRSCTICSQRKAINFVITAEHSVGVIVFGAVVEIGGALIGLNERVGVFSVSGDACRETQWSHLIGRPLAAAQADSKQM